MKATQLRVKTFSDATPAGLDTAIATFLSGLGEAELLGLEFSTSATVDSTDTVAPIYAAQLTYTT